MEYLPCVPIWIISLIRSIALWCFMDISDFFVCLSMTLFMEFFILHTKHILCVPGSIVHF